MREVVDLRESAWRLTKASSPCTLRVDRVQLRLFLVLSLLGVAAFGAWFTGLGRAQETNRFSRAESGGGRPVAVVELFTSEGCSSCPPADAVLRGLRGEDIIPLSFHVDYWNRLGWSDPFSDTSFSERQRQYARVFDEGRVYTPQAVVNGRFGLVGSRERALRERIREATRLTTATIELSLRRNGGALELTHRAQGTSSNALLYLAIVESNLEIRVPRGENRGRTLRHDHVVRELRRVEGTSTSVSLATNIRPEHASLVVFAQDPRTRIIEGASRTPVLTRD